MKHLKAKVCTACNGTGHDKGGEPIVKMVEFHTCEHDKYITSDTVQTRYHKTIRQGSGCMNCFGRGFTGLEAE